MTTLLSGVRGWVFCGAFTTLVGIACSSKSADESYSTAYAKAICDSLAPCCMANGFTFDKGQCELGGGGFVQSGNDAAKKAGAMFDQKAADDCVAAVRTLAAQCKTGADDLAATVACKRVWVGTKAAGSACSSNFECAPGAGYGACVMGVCVVMTSGAKTGDVCSGNGAATLADCNQSGLQCDALGSKTCVAQTPIGSACGPLTTCAKGAFCDGASGKCAATLAMGAACNVDTECSSSGCIANKCAANDLATSKPCNGT
jgi:hypothetical protein